MKKCGYGFILILVWSLVLAVLYSALSVIRHDHFQSGGFDLGIYDQAVWQYSKFISPYNTIKDRFILGDHLTFTLPFLAPLYWIWNDVRILLFFQAFWVSLSTIAIYKLVRLLKFSEITALCISVVYSLFYGIQFLVFFDFHPVSIGVGLLPWIAYFLESKRKKLLIISIILLLLTQENMGIACMGLGFIYFFRKPFRKTGGIFILVGTAWSVIAMKIIGLFSPVGFQYMPQIFPNPITILHNFFDAPEKQQVLQYTLTSFSFLPILSPGAMLAVALDLAQYFVTGLGFSRMWSPFTHHRAILAVFVTLGAIEGLKWMRRRQWNVEIVAIVLLISGLGQQYLFHFPLNKLAKTDYWKEEQWMRDNRELINLVPKDASVAGQQNLVPHLSHRKEIYLVYPKLHDYDDSRCGKRQCWWLDFAGKPQYFVADLRPYQWLTQILETNEHFDEAVKNMEKSGAIALKREINFAKLYRIVD